MLGVAFYRFILGFPPRARVFVLEGGLRSHRQFRGLHTGGEAQVLQEAGGGHAQLGTIAEGTFQQLHLCEHAGHFLPVLFGLIENVGIVEQDGLIDVGDLSEIRDQTHNVALDQLEQRLRDLVGQALADDAPDVVVSAWPARALFYAGSKIFSGHNRGSIILKGINPCAAMHKKSKESEKNALLRYSRSHDTPSRDQHEKGFD